MEEWRQIFYDGFEGYDVSSLGQIQNRKTGRIHGTSVNEYGVVWVGLWDARVKKQRTLVVARIVADHFVPGNSAEFDTPININGDRLDNSAANLQWRPRWFAVQFFHQFKKPVVWTSAIFVESGEDEGQKFADSRDAAVHYGLLETDIMKSVLNGEHTFPTWQTFARA